MNRLVKIAVLILLIMAAGYLKLAAQAVPDTSVYLITCGPGTETYSIYGHTAIRVVIPDRGIDVVYNWGVFDFRTPNFVLKFATGKLDYMLDTESYRRFLQSYLYEERWVRIQKMNLSPCQKKILLDLISENLRPENVKYRYNFFGDNCSTRVRDIIEKALGSRLIYTTVEPEKLPSFRFLSGKYQEPYAWLNFGIDLLLGTPSDRNAGFRDRMFLPIELKNTLSEACVNQDGKMIPLLQNHETVLDFATPRIKRAFYTSPPFVLTLLCILLLIFFYTVRNNTIIKIADILLFFIYSCLALMLLFTGLISEHEQLHRNLNMLWLSPFLPLCLAAILANRKWFIWFRIVFVLCVVSILIQMLYLRGFNGAIIPLVIILGVRSSARAGLKWNPLSLRTF